MKITLKGFQVDKEINYKIVSIDKCCDKIVKNPVIDLRSIEGDNYFNNVPAITLTKTNIYYDPYEDYPDTSEEYYPITYCPFCGSELEIIIDEIIDVTEDYNTIQKEADEYYKKANKSNSKKREHELRKQGHQISKLLDWWLTTESLHSEEEEEY